MIRSLLRNTNLHRKIIRNINSNSFYQMSFAYPMENIYDDLYKKEVPILSFRQLNYCTTINKNFENHKINEITKINDKSINPEEKKFLISPINENLKNIENSRFNKILQNKDPSALYFDGNKNNSKNDRDYCFSKLVKQPTSFNKYVSGAIIGFVEIVYILLLLICFLYFLFGICVFNICFFNISYNKFRKVFE